MILLVIFGFLGLIAKSIKSGKPLINSRKYKKQPKASSKRKSRPEMTLKSNEKLSKGVA